MLHQHVNGFFRVIKAEDDDGILAAFLHKGVKVFHVDSFFGNNFHDAMQAARFIGNFHGDHRGFTDLKAAIFKNLIGFFDIINNQTQNAEINRFRQRQSSNIDVGFLEHARCMLERAGFVFQKNRYLFYFHRNPLMC